MSVPDLGASTYQAIHIVSLPTNRTGVVSADSYEK